tara:strand:- start:149 stop:1474 length:1326 start_codon:yes stop_codon:yes gene_type:complete
MACGRIALERCGFDIEKYYASEIDKYAIKVAKANYPDIIHIGDVCNVTAEDYQDIDLLMGGSPCQGFSFAGKKLNFDDPRSALFFEFVRILQEVRPKYFLLENVRMKKEYQDIITEHLGVEPIMINSALVSAQNRVRLYWTNIPNVEQPEDRGIILRDVLEEYPNDHVKMSDTFVTRQQGKSCLTDMTKHKASNLSAMEYVKNGRQGDYIACDENGKPVETVYQYVEHPNYYQFDVSGKGYNSQQDRIRKTEAKSNTLAAGHASIPKVVTRQVSMTEVRTDEANQIRYENRRKHGYDWSPRQLRHLVERTDNKSNAITPSLTKQHIIKEESAGIWGYPRGVRTSGMKDKNGKTPAVTGSSWQTNNFLSDGISYRKLTPVECERLQTIPDNYTNYVSNTQRYKMIGNGWTVEVIRHIFKNMKPPTNKVTSDRKNLNTSLIVR